jgi:tripartite-type tricarboxylate transporter receptor subunit TctC
LRHESPEEAMAHQEVYRRLRAILVAYEGRMPVLSDGPASYELGLPSTPDNRQGMFVAAARDGKAYASFHLMPVYAFPEMLDSVSPELKKRMQGKSCFNFSLVDEPLFTELEGLTARGIERFRELDVSRISSGRPSR